MTQNDIASMSLATAPAARRNDGAGAASVDDKRGRRGRAIVTGERFGRLTVIREADRGNGARHRGRAVVCMCVCGTERTVLLLNLTSSKSSSCGCLLGEINRSRGTHHKSKTNEYKIWVGMLVRCFNKNCAAYPDYGGRGVGVCDRWRHDFESFLADMGPRPSRQHSLERVNNDGNYEPGNCRWATRIEQARNTRATRMSADKATLVRRLWADGGSTQAQLAARFGVSRSTICHIVTGRKWRDEP